MTNGSAQRHIEQSVAALQALSRDFYVGRIACPMENLGILTRLGVLIGQVAATSGSLFGVVLCAIPAAAFDQMNYDRMVDAKRWFCRRGPHRLEIPDDLTCRTLQALQSDLNLCQWMLAVRTCSSDVAVPNDVRLNSRWRHRIFDAPAAEISRIERDLLRVESELAAREQIPYSPIFNNEIYPYVIG